MKKMLTGLTVFAFALSCTVFAWAEERTFLQKSLIGAGTGAAAAAISGSKGRDVWKGALAGTAVNLVGGALVDSMSGERVSSSRHVSQMTSSDAFSQGYEKGFNNGYRQGYAQGLRDGVRDASGYNPQQQAPSYAPRP